MLTDTGMLLQGGSAHVQRLGARDVANARGRHTAHKRAAPNAPLVLSLGLVGQRDTSAHGHLGADDTGTTPEVGVRVVQVHGTALALAAAVGEAEHLSHELLHRAATHQVDAVAPVRCDDAILARQAGLEARRHGLLPVVQVAEAADGARLVLHVAGDLRPPDQEHAAVVLHQLLLRGLGLVRRRLEV